MRFEQPQLAFLVVCVACTPACLEPARAPDQGRTSGQRSRAVGDGADGWRNALPVRVTGPGDRVGPFAFPHATCSSNHGCKNDWEELDEAGPTIATSPSFPTVRCVHRADGYILRATRGNLDVLVPRSRAASEDSRTWVLRRLMGVNGVNGQSAVGDLVDAVGTASGLWFGDSQGRITSGSGTRLRLRSIRGRVKYDDAGQVQYKEFGAADEWYRVDAVSRGEAARARRMVPDRGVESGVLLRFWVDNDWVLRLFGTPGGNLWEVAARKGGAARVVAYGNVGGCGVPLAGSNALAIQRSDNGYSILSIGLRTGELRQIRGIPLDKPQCVSEDQGILAVGGLAGGSDAVAIHAGEMWQLVKLSDKRSVVEPFVYHGRVVVAAPSESFVASGPAMVKAAGAVYLLSRTAGRWHVDRRVVASRPREWGLFGFRLSVTGSRVFVSHYVGPRESDATDGVADGTAEVCGSSW